MDIRDIKPKLSVMSVQRRILHAFIKYVPEFRELLHHAFIDSESLNIPCTLDNNYLCTVISCRQGAYYKRVVCVWPGGRREVWQLGLGKRPRSGENYIENFIVSPYQDVGEVDTVVGGAQPEEIKVPAAGVNAHMSGLLGRLQSLEEV